MRKTILSAMMLSALAAPALADSYPVSGRWGVNTGTQKGPIDCTGKRVISFYGDQRADSNGGVNNLRNKTVQKVGSSDYRVTDIFANGQASNGRVNYTLSVKGNDHVVLSGQTGTIKLQRCQ
jgi:hypothetical protein